MKTTQLSLAIADKSTKSETVELVQLHNGVPMTTSLQVAQYFGREHKNVLMSIRNLDCSPQFQELNFKRSFYISEIGNLGQRKIPLIYITRDGFTFLVMGFTGKIAAQFKEDYINAFNAMEKQLKTGVVPVAQYDRLAKKATDMLKELNDSKKENAQLAQLLRNGNNERPDQTKNDLCHMDVGYLKQMLIEKEKRIIEKEKRIMEKEKRIMEKERIIALLSGKSLKTIPCRTRRYTSEPSLIQQ